MQVGQRMQRGKAGAEAILFMMAMGWLTADRLGHGVGQLDQKGLPGQFEERMWRFRDGKIP